MIFIVCDQVLRHPSKQGTSSMWNPLLPKTHIAKSPELTDSEGSKMTSSTVNTTALAIPTRQGSQRVTIVCLHRKL